MIARHPAREQHEENVQEQDYDRALAGGCLVDDGVAVLVPLDELLKVTKPPEILSKRAMNYYTTLKAVEYGSQGIRVNAVLPGSTDTGMKAEFEKMAGGADKLLKENGAVGRLATSREMADPIVYPGSDMASFVSGLMFIADMGHNGETVLGLAKNQLDVPAALPLYNTKLFQKVLAKQTS